MASQAVTIVSLINVQIMQKVALDCDKLRHVPCADENRIKRSQQHLILPAAGDRDMSKLGLGSLDLILHHSTSAV
jgi:hypothetical protein